jgi:hypothetical protein
MAGLAPSEKARAELEETFRSTASRRLGARYQAVRTDGMSGPDAPGTVLFGNVGTFRASKTPDISEQDASNPARGLHRKGWQESPRFESAS